MKQVILQLVKLISFPLALLYGFIIWLRNKMYDLHYFSSTTFSLPVICVGNLSIGGTGKTPHIEYLIELLQNKYSVATLSRGYKRATRGFLLSDNNSTARDIGDEPFQYKNKYKNIAVAVGEDRMTAIPELLQRNPYIQTILLDDAFQHRTVIAGINILITDFHKRYTQDFILPFGTLRESREASHRAHIIIVSKCPITLSLQQKNEIIQELNPLPNQHIFFTSIGYKPLMQDGEYIVTQNQKNTTVLLITGIAKPEPLQQYLKEYYKAVFPMAFKDHHYFTFDDIEEINEAFKNIKTENKIIITTEKDYSRLLLLKQKIDDYKWPLYVQPIGIHFLFQESELFNQKIMDFIDEYYPIIDEYDDAPTMPFTL